MTTPTISTPGRIPVINFGDDADYEGLLTVLDNLDVVWQITVSNKDLSLPIPDDHFCGQARRGDECDTIIVRLWDEDGRQNDADGDPREITLSLDEITCFTYL